jgi:hypothetical protein
MLVFVVQGYESKNELGQLQDMVVLELFCDSEAEAIKRAEKLVKKSFYRVSGVIQKEA